MKTALITTPDCANTPTRAPSGEALLDCQHQRMWQTTVNEAIIGVLWKAQIRAWPDKDVHLSHDRATGSILQSKPIACCRRYLKTGSSVRRGRGGDWENHNFVTTIVPAQQRNNSGRTVLGTFLAPGRILMTPEIGTADQSERTHAVLRRT
jgi:hypothetical protein